jgi:hypothetical protein
MNAPTITEPKPLAHLGAQPEALRGVVRFNGSYDTLIKHPGSCYETLDWDGIIAMLERPAAVDKEQAPAIIPSLYREHDARAHDAQREHGGFVMLCVDIDKGSPPMERVIEATQAIVGKAAEFVLYSSSNSTAAETKWRVIVPLDDPLPGEEYAGHQRALFSLYADHGITCDEALARTAQPVYLPNVPPARRGPDGAPLFYAAFHHKGEPLALTPSCAIVERCRDLYRQERLEREQAAAEARQRHEARQRQQQGDEINPTQWFNVNHGVEQLLLKYGYRTDRRGHWRSPHQESGSFATTITDDGEAFISLSGSDRAKRLGVESKTRACVWGDAFDLYRHFEHGNDPGKAWAAIRRMMPRKPPVLDLDPGGLPQDPGNAPQSSVGEQGATQEQRGLVRFSDFVASLQPPDYLVDAILQRGWLYSLTAKTGSGKTAVGLDLALRVAEGMKLGALETTRGPVVYLSGENPEDVKARCLMLAQHHGVVDPEIYFLEGAIRLEERIDWLIRQIEEAGGASLVIVDTSASYFGGDDDNSNVELGEYARLFRRICKMDCRPTVLVLAHPTKNPSKENLVPRGGGAFLNEVDGNLTLWTDDKEVTTLHWQGKFRGPDFEPIQFRLKIVKHDGYMDSKGRSLPSVIALPIDFTQAERIEEETRKAEDRVLLSFDDHPDLSIRDRARMLGFVADNGTPLKGRVERVVAQLVQAKLLTRTRKKYKLTFEGEREVAELRGVKPGKKAA